MPGHGPSPDRRFPIPGVERSGYLKNFITRRNIHVGDYTYYDDPLGPARFEVMVPSLRRVRLSQRMFRLTRLWAGIPREYYDCGLTRRLSRRCWKSDGGTGRSSESLLVCEKSALRTFRP